MIEFRFVGIGFCVGLRDTFRHHLGITLLVASIFAVRTLHAGRILEKLAAQGATHDVVELLLHKLVTVLLMHLFLLLPDGALSAKTQIKWRLVLCMLDERHRQLYAAHRFQGKPGIDIYRGSLRLWTLSTTRASRSHAALAWTPRTTKILSWGRLKL